MTRAYRDDAMGCFVVQCCGVVAASLLAVHGLSCTVAPPEPKEPVEPPQAREACEAFCELRTSMTCEDTGDSPGPDGIDGTADDEPCLDVCRDIVTQGGFDPSRKCLDNAQSCDAATACIFGDEGG